MEHRGHTPYIPKGFKDDKKKKKKNQKPVMLLRGVHPPFSCPRVLHALQQYPCWTLRRCVARAG